MPRGLTDKQQAGAKCLTMDPPATTAPMVRRFVESLLMGKDPRKAASMAGFKNPALDSVALMRQENVQQALIAEAEARLLCDGAPMAVRCLIGLVRNRKTPPTLRAKCSTTILDRAGFVPPKAIDAPEKGEKPLHRQSREELQRLLQQAQKELADRAVQIVDAPQSGAQDQSKAEDLLG